MSDEQRVRRDPVVETALRLLPVPDHHPHFWRQLEARLDAIDDATRGHRRDHRRTLVAAPADDRAAVPALARSASATPVVELVPDGSQALVPPALRRRSNALLAAVAVAAAVVVVVAGTALVREHGGSGGTTEVASGPDTAVSSSSTTASTAALVAPGGDAPTQAVLGWVGALGTGDTATAWAAMGPASKAHFGTRSAFEAQRTDLAEGFGAWSAATPDEVFVTPVGDAGDLLVVTLVGTVQQEGSVHRRADAFPVRVVDGVPRVEKFAFAGELEVVVPELSGSTGTRAPVRRDDELVVVFPRGVDAPTLRLDDEAPVVCGVAPGTELRELEDAPGQRCSYRPQGGIPAGQRVLTVAFLAPDGSGVAAESILFDAR